jgi:uncharacterized membrane protein YdcZ (DUF606 family)
MAGLKSINVSAQLAQVVLAADELNGILEELNSTIVTPIQLEWVTQGLTASSVVSVSGIFYTCFYSHTSGTTTQPGVGTNWESYWYVGGSSGSAWVTSTAYTAIGDFTLGTDTLDVLSVHIQSGTLTYSPIEPLGLAHRQEDRTAIGLPTGYYMTMTTTPTLYFNYQPDDVTYLVHYLRLKALLSLDDPTSTTELDKGWYNYLRYALAANVGNYNQALPIQKRQDLERQSEKALLRTKARDFYRVCDKSK